jgi:tRNA threonylcarbamoyl adenosine modification protein YjeE
MTRSLKEPELAALGAALMPGLRAGAVVWLEGILGAGKTTLARAMVASRGASVRATSPTFALAQRYESPSGPVFHVDCYRLRSPDEAGELDWGELAGGNLLLIEWPERGGVWVPPADLRVRLGYGPEPDVRLVTLVPEPPGLP